jgi:hypothetical protein
MKIYDTFIFSNELDLLDLRLNTWATNEIKYGSKKDTIIDPRNPNNLPVEL